MKAIFILALMLLTCGLGTLLFQPTIQNTEELPFIQQYNSTILLVPLDSRPACTDFVADLGNLANIHVITPPQEILDHYKQAGNTKELRSWCKENAAQADAAIISIDMLIHGGLIASRHANATTENIENTLNLLEQLHNDYPKLPVYAFHILPRLWPADNEANNKYQKEILKYSKLVDQIYTFENPVDINKLNKITASVPTDILTNYNRVYQENLELNKKLVNMAHSGILKQLIIGQDDGESFGIPNITKRQLLHYISQKNIPTSKVFVTKGADEVAITLLANINGQIDNIKPKINIQYADDETPSIVMPYMANSIGTTISEKITMVNGTIVNNPDEADFILFVYVGSGRNVGYQYVVNQRIQTLLEQNYHVALVDLSEHFSADETILPILMQNSAPINQLVAYAGWNTASNSIGTAITQATIFTTKLKKVKTPEEKFTLYKNNLTFLTNRFLEDYFYLKESIDVINNSLKSEKTDIYDLKNRYLWANTILKAEMINKTYSLKNSVSYNRPIKIPLKDQTIEAKVTNLISTISYPWERTFEIKINSEIKLEKALDL